VKVNKIKNFVETVGKRPGMYVFSEGVTEFSGLIRGYVYSLQEQGLNDDDLLNAFSIWLRMEKFPFFASYEISWGRLLLLQYPNESKALNKFFELWAEFISIAE
jgi:hypothetical protein